MMLDNQIMWFIAILYAAMGVCYAMVCGMLAMALARVRNGTRTDQPPVTVVIAARNERDHIEQCLASIERQSYPADLYEVICVNDRSDDSTGEILAAWAARWKVLRVLTIETVPSGISPKKHALTRAIEAANGEIIIQTDADCVVPAEWIASMVRRFDPPVDLVAGVAPYTPGRGAVAGFVCHEYLWNVLLSAGSIIMGFGTHASGRNLAFRRSIFETLDGYGVHRSVLSGDDTLLMQQVQHHKPGSLATNPDPAAHVYTRPPESFNALVRQRIRHMSTGRLFQPVQLAVGAAVYGFHSAVIGFAVAAVIWPGLLWYALGGFAGKLAVDAIAFARTGRVFGIPVVWRRFIGNEVFMLLYFTIFPLLGAVVPVRWKEKG